MASNIELGTQEEKIAALKAKGKIRGLINACYYLENEEFNIKSNISMFERDLFLEELR